MRKAAVACQYNNDLAEFHAKIFGVTRHELAGAFKYRKYKCHFSLISIPQRLWVISRWIMKYIHVLHPADQPLAVKICSWQI